MRKYKGIPALTFQPWQYGDAWTKKTDIWGIFNAPEKTYHRWADVPKIPGLYIRPGRKKPSIAFLHKSAAELIPQFKNYSPKTDAEFRAITPPGFAEAFFKANQ